MPHPHLHPLEGTLLQTLHQCLYLEDFVFSFSCINFGDEYLLCVDSNLLYQNRYKHIDHKEKDCKLFCGAINRLHLVTGEDIGEFTIYNAYLSSTLICLIAINAVGGV